MAKISQSFLGYIIELEAFSMLFRPRESDTEVIQFQRSDYTPANAGQIYQSIALCEQKDDQVWSRTACLVFIYLLKTDRLLVMEGIAGTEHWFVKDRISGDIFDFDHRHEGRNTVPDNAAHETAHPVSADGETSMPTEACFALLERLQSSARRYPVNERITLANREDSDFITKKRGMDYLYQNGVFKSSINHRWSSVTTISCRTQAFPGSAARSFQALLAAAHHCIGPRHLLHRSYDSIRYKRCWHSASRGSHMDWGPSAS